MRHEFHGSIPGIKPEHVPSKTSAFLNGLLGVSIMSGCVVESGEISLPLLHTLHNHQSGSSHHYYLLGQRQEHKLCVCTPSLTELVVEAYYPAPPRARVGELALFWEAP